MTTAAVAIRIVLRCNKEAGAGGVGGGVGYKEDDPPTDTDTIATVYIPLPNQNSVLVLLLKSPQVTNEDLLNHILSTFTFTEKKSSRSTTSLDADFPLYPDAVLKEKIDPVPCPSVHSGFSSCETTVYTFTTHATAPQLWDFYNNAKEKNGWIKNGGAGAVDDQGYTNYGVQETWKKEDKTYSLSLIAAEGKVTNYAVGVPNN